MPKLLFNTRVLDLVPNWTLLIDIKVKPSHRNASDFLQFLFTLEICNKPSLDYLILIQYYLALEYNIW